MKKDLLITRLYCAACALLSVYDIVKKWQNMLNGRGLNSNIILSGICLIKGETVAVSHEVTLVEFDEMSEEEILSYVRANAPYDKAGAYAIQGAASAHIKGIRGDYFNVVGLPVHRMCRLYRENFGKNLI